VGQAEEICFCMIMSSARLAISKEEKPMNHRKILQSVAALACVMVAIPDFAGTHRSLLCEMTPLFAQASNPSTQTQGAGSGAKEVEKIGPGVSKPQPIYAPEPKLSKVFRENVGHGTVLINLIVETDGNPTNVHVFRIDLYDRNGESVPDTAPDSQELQKASVDAVSRYRFKPATKNGKPVRVWMYIEVNVDPANDRS
jgi:hypothetical protein